jgi:hypothetical protein
VKSIKLLFLGSGIEMENSGCTMMIHPLGYSDKPRCEMRRAVASLATFGFSGNSTYSSGFDINRVNLFKVAEVFGISLKVTQHAFCSIQTFFSCIRSSDFYIGTTLLV